jgi:MFS transporter, ACS family, tartrate transporter
VTLDRRIMITWSLISGLMAFVVEPYSLYAIRFILGAAEAGFFPVAILYLTYWLPSEYRARILATFTMSIPIATFIVSTWIQLLFSFSGVNARPR